MFCVGKIIPGERTMKGSKSQSREELEITWRSGQEGRKRYSHRHEFLRRALELPQRLTSCFGRW